MELGVVPRAWVCTISRYEREPRLVSVNIFQVWDMPGWNSIFFSV